MISNMASTVYIDDPQRLRDRAKRSREPLPKGGYATSDCYPGSTLARLIDMDDKKEQLDDPLIDEVRERRRQLSSRYGNDLQELFKAIRELQKEHPRIVLKPERK